MRPIRLICACLAALILLAACDKEAPTKPKAPPAPPPISTTPTPTPSAPAADQAPAVPAVPAPEEEATPAPSPAVPAPKPVSPPLEPVRPKAPPATATVQAPSPKNNLDLSLPKGLVSQLEPGDATDALPAQPVLPQMFVEKPIPESPFQLNGKLITNEHEDDYWRSVEGAELQFEFKR